MKYIAPHPGSGRGPNDEYIDGNPAESIIGSIPPAAAIEHPMREIMHVIDYAGLLPADDDPEDLQLLRKAIEQLITGAGTGTSSNVGMIGMFASSSAPSGWLKANGAYVDIATYPSLHAVVGTTYGPLQNNDTEFKLPDLQGEFLRGWDESGLVDAGRTLGSNQDYATARPQTSSATRFNDSNDGLPLSPAQGTLTGNPDHVGFVRLAYGSEQLAAGVLTADGQTVGIDVHNPVDGDAETRPRNVALLACIKT